MLGSLDTIGISLASLAVTGLTCSGADLYNLHASVVQMVWLFSWTTTFMGPNQCPGLFPLPCLQIMTHSPGSYFWPPGRERRSMALRKLASLSA